MVVKQISLKVCKVVWSASPVRMVKPELAEPKFPTESALSRRNIPEAATP